jgi:hypothetical protein
MIYGYARVSSTGQDLAQQLVQLDAAGCTKIYREKVSAATAERPQLKRTIGALGAGDVLMVTATDRLARNTRDLLNILQAVREVGAGFRSIAEPMVDTPRSSQRSSLPCWGSLRAMSAIVSPSAPRLAGSRPGPWREVRPARCPYPSPAGRSPTTACGWRYAAHRCCPAWC